MLFDDKRRALHRALAGALLGMAGGGLAAWAAGSLIAGSPSALALAFLNCGFPRGLEGVGIALSFALYALFGAEVGVATLPFAGDGSALVGRTLAHFALTAATVGLWVGLNFGVRETASFLVPLALVYLLVWLGRWVGWYAEVSAIRERLGLAPGPSLFHWRETLPYVPFAALLCLLLPFVLRLCDAGDVPVLSGLLYPYLLLPVGAFCSALSLGKRQGFCPLYPVACAGFLFCFALLARLVSNVADTDMLPIAFLAALAGGLTGAALRRRRGGAGSDGCAGVLAGDSGHPRPGLALCARPGSPQSEGYSPLAPLVSAGLHPSARPAGRPRRGISHGAGGGLSPALWLPRHRDVPGKAARPVPPLPRGVRPVPADRGRKADSRALPRSRPLRPAGQRGGGVSPGEGRNGLTGRMPFPDAPGVELRRAPFEKRRGQAPALWACGAVTGSSR
ncbi:MAG: DUF3021 domain-containing protein [Flavonifractor plautii]